MLLRVKRRLLVEAFDETHETSAWRFLPAGQVLGVVEALDVGHYEVFKLAGVGWVELPNDAFEVFRFSLN
jgi:hypothetical protein